MTDQYGKIDDNELKNYINEHNSQNNSNINIDNRAYIIHKCSYNISYLEHGGGFGNYKTCTQEWNIYIDNYGNYYTHYCGFTHTKYSSVTVSQNTQYLNKLSNKSIDIIKKLTNDMILGRINNGLNINNLINHLLLNDDNDNKIKDQEFEELKNKIKDLENKNQEFEELKNKIKDLENKNQELLDKIFELKEELFEKK
jgi:hypothetical protein